MTLRHFGDSCISLKTSTRYIYICVYSFFFSQASSFCDQQYKFRIFIYTLFTHVIYLLFTFTF